MPHDAPSAERSTRRQPTASMRLQLTDEFDFDAAIERFPVIARLGVSHVYLSPVTEAVPGSGHGYDVTDHTQVRSDFGGSERLDALLDAAAEHELGVIIDHVPNHVSVARAELNAPWWATLKEGPTSEAAAWFDIDWDATDGRVIVPKLGAPLSELLAAGEVTTGTGDLGAEVRVHGLRFPLADGTADLDVADALEQQHYRLAHWRAPERNVRRFFTIDDLVAVRVEDRAVAAVVDDLPRRLVDHPAFAGVRVDHVDGLAAPGDYLVGLREVIGDRLLLVEKIVAPNERLPEHWPVDGTTGYEHIDVVEHTLVDPAAEPALGRLWSRWAGDDSFEQVELAARAEVLADGLDPDFTRLAVEVGETASEPPEGIRGALDALTLAIGRYRTYLPGDDASHAVFDRVVATATDLAASSPEGSTDDVASVAELLLTHPDLLRRWQQLTGPAVAKGGEDRAFYRWFPLASLCEVGGDPGRFATSVSSFHDVQRSRQRVQPTAMLADTTHDTKRSAGVRTRSLALAARSAEWEQIVSAWSAGNTDVVDGLGGDDADPLGVGIVDLALQTSVTAQPIDATRLGDYLVKSAREADLVTGWTGPDEDVEATLRRLAATLVTDATDGGLADFTDRISRVGDEIGLATLALHLTCPGFPDLYQGSPRRLLSLVDPDNRAPVDWDDLEALIARVPDHDVAAALRLDDADLARAVLTERILRLRRTRPGAFAATAGYTELDVSGPAADHVIAYARTDEHGDPQVVVIVSRPVVDLDLDGTGVELPAGTWRGLSTDDAPHEEGGHRLLTELGAWRRHGSAGGFEVFERADH